MKENKNSEIRMVSHSPILPVSVSQIEGGVTAPKGFQAAGTACGLKASGRPDLALVYTEKAASAAAVFTSNALAAAPILVAKQQIDAEGPFHAVVINSGNANALTGARGTKDAWAMVKSTAESFSVPEPSVLPASTGIIGHILDVEKIKEGINISLAALSPDGGADAAQAILTTDLVSKEYAVKVSASTGEFIVGGMAKGSGMIAPAMATMIAVITTDLQLDNEQAKRLLQKAVDDSFNCISVDGCQSTNDVVFFIANGESGFACTDEVLSLAQEALTDVCRALAKKIARDGEGATKLLEVAVVGARTEPEARDAALSVVKSDLVKTAMFGCDPNWGRILASVGASGASLNPAKLSLKIDGLYLFDEGAPKAFDEREASNLLSKDTVVMEIDLGAGSASAKAWGCDLSYDYVKINAEYRT